MPDEKDQEKTEPATPKKREDLRKKGQVAQSKDLPSVAVLFSSLILFYFTGGHLLSKMEEMFKHCLQSLNFPDFNITFLCNVMAIITLKGFSIIAPLFVITLLFGIVGNLIQKGLLFSTDVIIPDISKLDPIKGLKNIFSLSGLNELLKSLLKIIIISYVAYITVKGEIGNLCPLAGMTVPNILKYICTVSFKLCMRISFLLIILAILDYAFNKWEFERKNRMTRQEVKDELKQREGDPLVRSRVRELQMQRARMRMMQEVPKADVVITNPTSLACALKYEQGKMPAPMLVAKGAGVIAKRIKIIAKDYDIPVIENKILAQTIYRLVKIGEVIPEKLYKAVAEILAYVYRLKGKI
ncbi:MAG: flagellar biosynthesis protein FlhB [Thermodesulfobacteriota bacterium]|nr:flagellar biosynthesis protein FlhB [Thermodesulfobacteriota bacterium]